MSRNGVVTVFEIGDQPLITATFTNAANALTNPTTVTFITVNPVGAEITTVSPNAQITNPSTGVWVYTFPGTTGIQVAGTWVWRVKGVGALIAADEGSWVVSASLVPTP